jgi:hypothetical protein
MVQMKTICQSAEFSERVLPELFHASPAEFLKYLTRDGNKFLTFYWNLAGQNIPDSCKREPFGLDYELHDELGGNNLIALIRMPKPRDMGDYYYSSLIFRPSRHLLLVSDMTKVINLEYGGEENGHPLTLVSEVTRKIQRVDLGQGPRPFKQDMVDFVIETLKTE